MHSSSSASSHLQRFKEATTFPQLLISAIENLLREELREEHNPKIIVPRDEIFTLQFFTTLCSSSQTFDFENNDHLVYTVSNFLFPSHMRLGPDLIKSQRLITATPNALRLITTRLLPNAISNESLTEICRSLCCLLSRNDAAVSLLLADPKTTVSAFLTAFRRITDCQCMNYMTVALTSIARTSIPASMSAFATVEAAVTFTDRSCWQVLSEDSRIRLLGVLRCVAMSQPSLIPILSSFELYSVRRKTIWSELMKTKSLRKLLRLFRVDMYDFTRGCGSIFQRYILFNAFLEKIAELPFDTIEAWVTKEDNDDDNKDVNGEELLTLKDLESKNYSHEYWMSLQQRIFLTSFLDAYGTFLSQLTPPDRQAIEMVLGEQVHDIIVLKFLAQCRWLEGVPVLGVLDHFTKQVFPQIIMNRKDSTVKLLPSWWPVGNLGVVLDCYLEKWKTNQESPGGIGAEKLLNFLEVLLGADSSSRELFVPFFASEKSAKFFADALEVYLKNDTTESGRMLAMLSSVIEESEEVKQVYSRAQPGLFEKIERCKLLHKNEKQESSEEWSPLFG